MASRTYPNDYFAWYNDDQRLGVLCLDTTSTDSNDRYIMIPKLSDPHKILRADSDASNDALK